MLLRSCREVSRQTAMQSTSARKSLSTKKAFRLKIQGNAFPYFICTKICLLTFLRGADGVPGVADEPDALHSLPVSASTLCERA